MIRELRIMEFEDRWEIWSGRKLLAVGKKSDDEERLIFGLYHGYASPESRDKFILKVVGDWLRGNEENKKYQKEVNMMNVRKMTLKEVFGNDYSFMNITKSVCYIEEINENVFEKLKEWGAKEVDDIWLEWVIEEYYWKDWLYAGMSKEYCFGLSVEGKVCYLQFMEDCILVLKMFLGLRTDVRWKEISSIRVFVKFKDSAGLLIVIDEVRRSAVLISSFEMEAVAKSLRFKANEVESWSKKEGGD